MIEFSDGFEEAPRARRELVERVEPLIAKYMQILGVDTPPKVVVKDNIGSRWLGRAIFTAKDRETTIELQRKVFDDARTLERVLAHEMIHHKNFNDWDERTVALLRVGIKPPGHGSAFLQEAKHVNEVMGADYVTETSDESYVLPDTTKPFYLLIFPWAEAPKRLGYRWGVRVTHQTNLRVKDAVLRRDAVLVVSQDPRWTWGSKLGDRDISIPREASVQEELQKLHAAGSELTDKIKREAT